MRIFITGGHGFLGGYLVALLEAKDHHVLAPTEKEFDITSEEPYRLLRNNTFSQYDVVMNLAAYTNVGEAEKDDTEALRVNTSLDWLGKIPESCMVYHISTDYVYDGNTPNSKETDLLAPFNKYGRSKALGDMKLLSYCRSNIHIIRTSFKPIRWPYPVAWEDQYTNADTVDIIAGMIEHFLRTHPPGGIYNIGTERKSVYELAKRNNPSVQPASIKNFPFLKPEVTMDLTKYQKHLLFWS